MRNMDVIERMMYSQELNDIKAAIVKNQREKIEQKHSLKKELKLMVELYRKIDIEKEFIECLINTDIIYTIYALEAILSGIEKNYDEIYDMQKNLNQIEYKYKHKVWINSNDEKLSFNGLLKLAKSKRYVLMEKIIEQHFAFLDSDMYNHDSIIIETNSNFLDEYKECALEKEA